MKNLVSIITIIVIVLFSSLAFGQEVQGHANSFHTDNGYGYEFDDDPLAAGGFGTNESMIKVRPMAARTTLIRPRTSFVYERLKSGENI